MSTQVSGILRLKPPPFSIHMISLWVNHPEDCIALMGWYINLRNKQIVNKSIRSLLVSVKKILVRSSEIYKNCYYSIVHIYHSCGQQLWKQGWTSSGSGIPWGEKSKKHLVSWNGSPCGCVSATWALSFIYWYLVKALLKVRRHIWYL